MKKIMVTIASEQELPIKETQSMVRLNLKIPSDIKEYLYAAAYRESSPKKQVSVTEYLCGLVRKDMMETWRASK